MSYSALIRDHREIMVAAAGLLRSLSAPSPDLGSITYRFHRLATIVGEHIAVERPLVGAVDTARLAQPWRDKWLAGLAIFRTLCAQWEPFVARWDDEAIRGDVAGFREAARGLVSHLDAEMELETETFYAVLCQSRVISMA